MTALEYRIQVNPRREGVEVTWVGPDGEIATLGTVTAPSHLPALVAQIAGFISLELMNAVWEVRTSM